MKREREETEGIEPAWDREGESKEKSYREREVEKETGNDSLRQGKKPTIIIL